MYTLLTDLRFTLRSLWSNTRVTMMAALTLALGIGASTVILSVTKGVLLDPLPYEDSDRLTLIWSEMAASSFARYPISGPELNDLRTRSELFEEFASIWTTTIVDALKVQLTSEEDRGIAEKPIADAQAYDCYLRARHEYSRATRDGVEAALRYLDEGLEIVGPDALLYAAKGYAYFNLAIVDTFRHREYLETCREWAEKIFELEHDSARGHGLLGLVLFDLFETVEGIRHMERAFSSIQTTWTICRG